MKWRCSSFALLLAAVLATAATASHASDSFEAVLQQAEATRSTDPGTFKQLLGQLNTRIAEATPAQRQQLRYLKIYELGFTGRYDLAVKEATALFDDVDDPALKLRAGALIVNSYAATRNLSEGLRYLDLTLELIDRVPDPELRSHGWYAASALYQQMGQFELSQHYGERILEASAVPRTRCFAGIQVLEAKRQLDQLPADDAPIQAVVRECEAQGEILVAGFARAILARQWARRGDVAAAVAMLEDHLEAVEATRYPRLIGEIQSLLGELHLVEGNLDAATRYARLALDRKADMAFSQPLVQAHRTLYQSALQRGDKSAALQHHIDYADADKAYLDHIKAREIAYQAVKHETREKTQTIELLNSQNRLLQLEQQVNAKSTQAKRLLIALLAVLLASIGYWAVKTKRMQMQFRHLAQTDALTGISNRHHFTLRAEALLEQCRKNGEEAGLVMLDLDNFKSINDQFGHAAGDWTLKQVALVCEQLRGPRDLVGRLGGEEFAFLLVGSDVAASTALAQACRERIAGIDTGQSGHRFGITASFGLAGSRACGFGFDTLLARADDALYRSKREGRNRVTVHTADLAPSASFPASRTA